MTANHGYYGTRTPKEFSVVGTGSGFDWLTVSDGFLAGDMIESLIKMENQGGNDWRFEIVQNGIGEATVDFTHDFSTGLYDIEVEFAINDNVKQVITIMDFDDSRPSDFLWFPNRAPEDSIRLVYNTFSTSPSYVTGRRTVNTGLMTHSTDSDYVYWNATLDDDTISIRANKQTGAVGYSFALATGTPSSSYYLTRYIAWPFHMSFFYGNAVQQQGPSWDGFAYDEDDPPIVERFQFTELFDEDFEGTTYRSDIMTPDNFTDQIQWRRHRLQINNFYLERTSSDSEWIVDNTPLEDAMTTLAIVNSIATQRAAVQPSHDEVTVAFSVDLAGGSGSITAFPKTFAIDGDGRFSGNMTFRVFKTTITYLDVLIPVSGRVVSDHVPVEFWPDTDEEFDQLQQTKMWLPEYYSKGREHDDPSYNWMLTKDTATKILGKPAFTHATAPTYNQLGPGPITPVTIAVESGSLPTGMSVSTNLNASHSELNVSGTPTADENGTVQFRIRSSIFKYDGTGTNTGTMEQLDYVSKVYSWIVGDGSPITFTLEYPSPFTNTATPPGTGFDWRIDGTTAVLTNYSITATVTGGTSPFTFSLHSGTLPPNALLNTSTGAIYTTGINTLEPSETGSCVIKVVDDVADEAFSITYNWEYIG